MHRFVPQLHVQSVPRSQAFYELLGLHCHSSHGPEGEPVWMRMQAERIDMMLVKADGPVDAGAQAVLFYFYVGNVTDVRAHLIAHGGVDAGPFTGQNPSHETGAFLVFDPTYPFYLPEGMMRVQDPDGYVILVSQISG